MSHQIIALEEMRSFIKRAMVSIGTDATHAEILADVLVMGDYRGHFSHSLNRIELYLNEITKKAANSEGEPTILKETSATALVDGNHLLGPVVGKFCMDIAIQKAKDSGIGWVVAKGSNHFGIAGYYSLLALKHNLLGMSFTNSAPCVCSTRGKNPILGTNPLSLAAPAKNGDSFVLDMATCVVAHGKIEIADRKGDPIPESWAIDKNGQPMKNSSDFHAMLPLGGGEKSSGYKGYGLAMLTEIFCSVLSGSTISPNLYKGNDYSGHSDLGQCFIAINPESFAPGFKDRMSDLIDECRSQEPANSELNVLVAGDIEKEHMNKCDSQGGIAYHPNQVKFVYEIASRLNIEPPKLLD